MTKPTKPTFRLLLTPNGPTWFGTDDAKGTRRLRAALKALLRSFGLRATSVEPAEPEPQQPADDEYAYPLRKS